MDSLRIFTDTEWGKRENHPVSFITVEYRYKERGKLEVNTVGRGAIVNIGTGADGGE